MNRHWLCNLLRFVVLMGAVLVTSCSAVQTLSDRDGTGRGFLQLLVEPDTAEVFINSEYQGLVSGWRDGVIPVSPGLQLLELRADGYMTQRFDLTVGANEQVTLELALERDLDEPTSEEQVPEHGAPLP